MSFGDIDIDTVSSFNPTKIFPWVKASLVKDGVLAPHPCGVYPQRISVDPVTKLSAIPYNEAEELGYMKLDFLHLTVYDLLKSRQEIEDLLQIEPDWTIMQMPSTYPKLFQLANHSELGLKIKPQNIDELADVLALIRPGKRQLIPLYMKSREMARQVLWALDDGGYAFKKAHAYGYALVIWLQLHLIDQGRL